MLKKISIASLVLCLFAGHAIAQGNFKIPWSSLNGGGAIVIPESSKVLSASIGQSIIGVSGDASKEMTIGFWSRFACVAIAGDANGNHTLGLSDIISIINLIFNKPGCEPAPLCWVYNLICRGDWNADTIINLSDVIRGVNYAFGKPGNWAPLPSSTCCLPTP